VTPTRRRATSLEELGEKAARLVSPDGRAAGLAFVPRPDDVVIAPFPKCGTTWLQQMVHSLRTGGDLDFDDISGVVPWIETAADLGIDLDAEQRARPRAFKSHLAWDDVPKGARYVVAVRDPQDALLSGYRFFEGWLFEPGSIGVEEFGRVRFLEGRDYHRHLVSWWAQRHRDDVLLLAYEHMQRDPEGTVRRVAEFAGIPDDPARIAIALHESSLATMQQHAEKYDDLMMRRHSESACDLPPGGGSGKVATGQVGRGRLALGPEFVAELDDVWSDTVGVEFGLADYDALLAELGRTTPSL
jgi:hypothetical protein